jgi:drug/metabolite transporter (DMT)-like permease
MHSPGSTASAASPWVSMAPAVFVLIWSTGFVVARFGMPHAPPMSFLAWRYVFSIVLLCVWVRLSRVAWPQGAVQWRHLLVAGMLLHGGYLGGVWAAVKLGLTAGAVALIVGLQPLLTAIWLSAQGGRGQIGRWQWLGLALGFGGLVLVVGGKVGTPEISAANLSLALGALASITVGTLYQKRYVQPVDVRSANTVQLIGALLFNGCRNCWVPWRGRCWS